MGDCPSQLTTRLVFEAVQRGVQNMAPLSFHASVSADLQARVRHEFDSVSGGAHVLASLAGSHPGLFSNWQDLLWLKVIPERFAGPLVQAGVVANIEELRTRTHICVSGCMECIDNADQSVHGALASSEHVSRGLLDLLRAQVIASERASYLDISAGQSIGAALQRNVGQPVVDGVGTPITVQIDDNGTPRQILLTKVLSTVSSAHGITPTGSCVRQVGTRQFEVAVPFVAAYRDERPLP